MSIIVALDYTNPLEALEMAAKLRDHVDGLKLIMLYGVNLYILKIILIKNYL